jgi:hypothetical protein
VGRFGASFGGCCLLERCGLSAGIAESQYWRGFPGWSFLPGAALGFPVSGYVAPSATTAVLPGGIVGSDSQAGRLRRAFLSVAGSRFAV